MESREERRYREREERKAWRRYNRRGRQMPDVKISDTSCRFPKLFNTEGCCICGHKDASGCSCTAMEALVHLERLHPSRDSKPMRDLMGCQISGSEPVNPALPGQAHQGMFQAPCGDMVGYLTQMNLPTMGHYRWHAVYDHLTEGACNSPSECEDGLKTGNV